ncbi:unnamed protein product [[Candida] boidinii]|uniref:Unnamed protein product n=1 Tax=Candida boidinii TaxID=5477 RepID=A0ACB5TJW0_CANBO|nr:unnamed protein product [[Candida] boidinii]
MTSVIVHPLALLNISDYLKRLESIGDKADNNNKILIGGILGKFNKKFKKYSIFITFEIKNFKDLNYNLKLYKQIYPNLKFIGVYEYNSDDEIASDREYINHMNNNISDNEYSIDNKDMIILKLKDLINNFKVIYMNDNDNDNGDIKSVFIKVIKIENLVINTINQVKDEYEYENKEINNTKILNNFKESVIKLNYKINLIINFLLSLSEFNYNYKINLIIKSINKIIIDLKLINYKYKSDNNYDNNNDKRIIEYLILNQSIILNNYYKLDKLLSIEKEIESI